MRQHDNYGGGDEATMTGDGKKRHKDSKKDLTIKQCMGEGG